MAAVLTRDQIGRHSPGIRVLIGVAIIDGIAAAGILAWNVGEYLVERLKAPPSSG